LAELIVDIPEINNKLYYVQLHFITSLYIKKIVIIN